ncbi:MAG: hypothetical protein RL092_1390, partial [Bacteroidota bacterium]
AVQTYATSISIAAAVIIELYDLV